ncbi:MAG TPA: hypothetical protein VFW33_00785 [Gemmataceae bacterium]|nr:hypothetical protein [Gemmataceae bacterium]
MTEVIDQSAPTPPAETPSQTPPAETSGAAAPDLATEVQRVLAASDEPLTVPKIRAKLHGGLRNTDPKALTEVLERQVAANALYKYPKYRSPQDRYWDRGMEAHVSQLMFVALDAGPLPWSELRRKLPAYAHEKAPDVRDDLVRQGKMHRHPKAGSRGAERYGNRAPDPKDYLRQELPDLFARLSSLGFTRPQIRAAALELLHEEEWDVEPAPAPEAAATPEEAPEPAAETHTPHAGPHTPAVTQAETHPEAPDAAQTS